MKYLLLLLGVLILFHAAREAGNIIEDLANEHRENDTEQ